MHLALRKLAERKGSLRSQIRAGAMQHELTQDARHIEALVRGQRSVPRYLVSPGMALRAADC